MKMSKPVCLVFALVILTTILCNNSVCSQWGSWKQSVACGCRIHPIKGLKCTKGNRPITRDDYIKVFKCFCRNPQKYLRRISKKDAQKMCGSNSGISLPF